MPTFLMQIFGTFHVDNYANTQFYFLFPSHYFISFLTYYIDYNLECNTETKLLLGILVLYSVSEGNKYDLFTLLFARLFYG